MKRPWQIFYRYRKHSTLLDAEGAYAGWTPWFKYPSTYATKEAAERMAEGDFGYYLSFAAKRETRIVHRDQSGGTT